MDVLSCTALTSDSITLGRLRWVWRSAEARRNTYINVVPQSLSNYEGWPTARTPSEPNLLRLLYSTVYVCAFA
jgi:hypothetical protein